MDWGGGARNSFELFVGLKPIGNGHIGSSAGPRRSRDSDAIDSLHQFSVRFVYLGNCPGCLGLGAGNGALLFPPTALASRAAMAVFLSLTAMDVASFATKRVLGASSMSLATSFSSLSPDLDVRLPEKERSSGEQKGNQRGN